MESHYAKAFKKEIMDSAKVHTVPIKVYENIAYKLNVNDTIWEKSFRHEGA